MRWPSFTQSRGYTVISIPGDDSEKSAEKHASRFLNHCRVPTITRGHRRRLVQGGLFALLVLCLAGWHLGWISALPFYSGFQRKVWAIQLPQSSRLVGSLQPWPPKHDAVPSDQPPLSVLGHEADIAFDFGATDPEAYAAQLRDFVDHAFPKRIQPLLRQKLDAYLHNGNAQRERHPVAEEQETDRPTASASSAQSTAHRAPATSDQSPVFGPWSRVPGWDDAEHKFIWQTDKNRRLVGTGAVKSWSEGATQHLGWNWTLMTDVDADAFVDDLLGNPDGDNRDDTGVHYMWKNLQLGILRADVIRYLLLLLCGGIYSDTDTRLLKLPSEWGRGANLWKNGEGWLGAKERHRISRGEAVDDVLGRPSVVIGIEADVGDRQDWNEWWPRPLQMAQWTMALAPYHPIALSTLLRALHSTAKAADWTQKELDHIRDLCEQGQWYEATRALKQLDAYKEPRDGGPVGIMNWTGPGIWTDAIVAYLYTQFGVRWTDLRGLTAPLRLGDVVVLPVTGFSPGVGAFGAGEPKHPEAMVEHLFRGSWKPKSEQGDAGRL